MNSPWPLLITLVYVAIAMVIGLRARAGRSMNSLEEWGVAGRSMGPVTLYLLIAAGSVSAYTFMGARLGLFQRRRGILCSDLPCLSGIGRLVLRPESVAIRRTVWSCNPSKRYI